MDIKLQQTVFRCSKRDCQQKCSIRKFTFFYGSRLPCSKILFMGYCWVNDVNSSSAIRMTGHSEHTITNFYGHFRRLVASTLTTEDTIIGGMGIEVEIDETKLGKRKYNRGHRVDGVWVLVGVERTIERKVFCIEVPDRSAETLLAVIESHVLPGSIVMTDMWRGYASLGTHLGLEHYTVNHSVEFVNSLDGTCTNTVEGTNNGLKIRIKPRNRVAGSIEEHLSEFIWRRKHNGHLWAAFLDAIREIHYEFDK